MKLLAVLLPILLLGADESTARAQPLEEIRFVDALPAPYHLVHLQLAVDGVVQYDGPLEANAWVSPGARHRVDIVADYTLKDPILSYVDGYHVELRSTYETPSIRLGDGTVHVIAEAAPRGGVTVPLDRRASIAWQER
jgi:hypothetical protein